MKRKTKERKEEKKMPKKTCTNKKVICAICKWAWFTDALLNAAETEHRLPLRKVSTLLVLRHDRQDMQSIARQKRYTERIPLMRKNAYAQNTHWILKVNASSIWKVESVRRRRQWEFFSHQNTHTRTLLRIRCRFAFLCTYGIGLT